MRATWLIAALLLPSTFGCVPGTPPPAPETGSETAPPNIVLLIGDDLGWTDAGFMGSPHVRTPNLDRLAAEGTLFSNGMSTASVCRPALRTLLSGLRPEAWSAQHERVTDLMARTAFMRDKLTLPRQLRTRGYASYEAGKFWESLPEPAGFTAGTAVGGGPLAPEGLGRIPSGMDGVKDFLDRHQDEPFFLWLAPLLPHSPFDADPEFEDLYRDQGLTETAIRYYANTTRMDAFFGEVVQMLEDRGLAEDTLVVYVSDNGWEQDPYEENIGADYLGGPRGKLSIYELGFRTPIIFWMPGTIPGGAVHDDLVTFVDLHATLLDFAGVPIQPSHKGLSQRPRLEGNPAEIREDFYSFRVWTRTPEEEFTGANWQRLGFVEFLRTDEWRYVRDRSRGEHELFRIDADPLEQFDVADQHPEVMAEMQARIEPMLDALTQPPADLIDVYGVIGDPTANAVLASEADRFEITPDEDGLFLVEDVPAALYFFTLEDGREMAFSWWQAPLLPLDLTGFQDSPFLQIGVVDPTL